MRRVASQEAEVEAIAGVVVAIDGNVSDATSEAAMQRTTHSRTQSGGSK